MIVNETTLQHRLNAWVNTYRNVKEKMSNGSGLKKCENNPNTKTNRIIYIGDYGNLFGSLSHFLYKRSVYKNEKWHFLGYSEHPFLNLHIQCCSSQIVSSKFFAISTPMVNTYFSLFQICFTINRLGQHIMN